MRRRVIAVVLACLLTVVSIFEISQIAMAHTEKIITVTFINNDQFIIDDGTGPVIYTDVIQEPAAADPDPDIILITHDHGDHFDPIVVEQMANTYGATVVGPNPVIDALEGSVPPEQLVRMDPLLYERMNLTIQGINIKAYHGSCDNNSYRFTLEEGVVSIYHSGDNMQADFEQYISNGYTELFNLDIAMIANWFDLNSFNSSYHPNVMIEMHFGDHCDVYENYPGYITLYSEDSWQYQYIPSIDVRDGTTPIIDGTSSPGEWDDASSIRFYNGQGEIDVSFKHNTTTLFFMSHIVDSTYYWGDDIVIGIDTEHNGDLHPQSDDYQFYIRRDVSTSEINRGSGSGWEPVPVEEWAGHVWNVTSSDASTWTAELSISYSFLNITDSDQVMGIEFRSYDDNPQGWFNWPEGSDETWPDSWADMSSSDNWDIEYLAKTLYVGGSGSGNYTHIQWAIENASDGDTVFVYDDSAPYYENVWVDRSINITGENRDTTIINGSGNGDVVMIRSDWINITGFTITSGSQGEDTGIGLDSSYATISDNNIIFNNDYGIYFYSSSRGNKILNNNISSNSYGAMRLYDRGNNITGNIISSNGGFGIFLDSSSGNNVTDNIISSNSQLGLYLYHSSENTITGNTMIQDGIYIRGDQFEHWNTHVIDTTNTVNDKPVYYWKNLNSGIVPGGAGQVILANCTNIEIATQELTQGSVGILMGFSSYNNITNNNVSNNSIGIFLCHSNGNNITNNNASFNEREGIYLDNSCYNDITNNTVLSNNEYGIYLRYSPENNLIANIVNSNNERGILLGNSNWNTLLNNTVNLNNFYGIYLSSSNGNTISNNTVFQNINYGIYLQDSSSNDIYHNNFIDNTNQANDDGTNNWDNDYPSGGNYWNDWTSPDDNSGPNQNEPGSDGIVDNARAIEGGSNQDRYPYTTENGWQSQPPTNPVHNIDTDEYFDAIQDAIDDPDTLEGHIIEVSAGTYYENVVVDKTITLIGEDRDATIIDGGGNGDVVQITANWVNVSGFTVTGSGVDILDAGIGLYNASNCNVFRTNVPSDNRHGIVIMGSNGNNIINNSVFSKNSSVTQVQHYGILINGGIGNNIINNSIFSNNDYDIFIAGSSMNNITDNTMIDGGIFIGGNSIDDWNTHKIDTSNTVNGKPIIYWKDRTGETVPLGAGQIILANCSNIVIESQELSRVCTGILLGFSSNNNINKNNVSFTIRDGILLQYSNWNNIIDNNVSSNSWYGITIESSENNTIANNTCSSNKLVSIYLHLSSSNNIINNNALSNGRGIRIHHSNGNNIGGNNVSYNLGWGILLEYSSNNNIYENSAFKNFWGVSLQDSNENIVTDNIIWDNEDGIDLIQADENYIICNIVIFNENGIRLSYSSTNNHIYHNNIIDNINQSHDDTNNENTWDNGYPSGGNYWSNYTGTDNDGDGIGDIPYEMDSNSKDIYPLMEPWELDNSSPIIELISPSNNSLIKPGIMIDIAISDSHLYMVTYSVNGGADQTIVSPYYIDTSEWDDGNCIVMIYAVDSYSNSNTTWFNFIADSIPPSIELVSPDNNSFITGNLEIDLTISDINLNQVSFSKNSGSAIPLPPPYNINTSSWPDGEYTITVYADDLAGNYNEGWFLFIKDTTLPEITLNSPENNSLLLEDTTLDFDISDANLDSVRYSINHGSFMIFESPYDLETTNWEDGEYIITIRADDLADNEIEKWFVFRLDTSPPSISLTSPVDGGSDVTVDGKIIIEFGEPMDCESVESAISITPYIEYTCIWTNDNKTLTLNFSEPLEYDTLYQISISSKAEDLAGRKLDGGHDFEFTTIGKPKEKEEDGFPIVYLLLALLMAIVAVVVIVALVTAKKKKAPGEVVEAQAETVEAPQTIQFTCSNCNNLLQVNDIGEPQNVNCPFCSTLLTVQSRKAPVQMPQPQAQQPTINISCPKCRYGFTVVKTGSPLPVQCPNCGTKGTI